MEKKKAIIIGGGISGLASAWYLRNRCDILLLEKEARVGGFIQSERVGDFLFEKGPRSLRFGKALELAKELGLEKEIILADRKAKKRYLYSEGKLKNVNHFVLKALPALLTEWRKKKGEKEETVEEFVSRRCGRSVYETLMDPLISGIYAGDGGKLSLKSCFPSLYEKEQKWGSLTKGFLSGSRSSQKGIFTFKDGLETLIRGLERNSGAKILVSTLVQDIRIYKDHIQVSANGKSFDADQVILALPASKASQLLKNHDVELARLLEGIEAASVAVVNVGYFEPVLKQEGFGYLIPRKEKEPVLGVVFDSSVFPEQGSSSKETRLTVMIGGSCMADFERWDKKMFIEEALKALGDHLGIKMSPDKTLCTIAKRAIPQYTLGFDGRLQMIKERLSCLSNRLHLIGSSFDGVSVGDCITGAERVSESLF